MNPQILGCLFRFALEKYNPQNYLNFSPWLFYERRCTCQPYSIYWRSSDYPSLLLQLRLLSLLPLLGFVKHTNTISWKLLVQRVLNFGTTRCSFFIVQCSTIFRTGSGFDGWSTPGPVSNPQPSKDAGSWWGRPFFRPLNSREPFAVLFWVVSCSAAPEIHQLGILEVCPPLSIPLFLPPSSLDYRREPFLPEQN